MIKQAEDEYKPIELEQQVRDFWRRAKVYPKTVLARAHGEDFSFVDGPPFTTGSIHLGQALNKTVKDFVLRWRRMHGYNVRDQPGYDMHGLPIEVQVEKRLGITNKREIEDLGISKFVKACRDYSMDLLKQMNVAFAELGVWMDWDHPYTPITTEYIEAAWWTFRKAHEKGLLYEALRSIQWCSRCQTALAEAEIEYSDESDPSIYVKFPLKDRPEESLLIWTTTPWTLPANLAIAVQPNFIYAKVRIRRADGSEFVWVLRDQVPSVLAKAGVKEYEIVETRPGSDLVGWKYTYPLAWNVPANQAMKGEHVHRVLPSETVEAEHTGLVHTAPGHGPEDFELGQKFGLPIFSPVNVDGLFGSDAGAYAGMPVRGEGNERILGDLRTAGVLFAEETLPHAYGHCSRCKTPIIFRATVQWFLKIVAVRERMLEQIRRVQWSPDWAGSARQVHWTANLHDWCISRQRYWGIPLPIWRCANCGRWTVVGSTRELRGARGFRSGMDLHRPTIDAIVLACKECGDEMRRIPDVLDVWFDSGVASWASLGYPARENEFKRWWPTKWIVEGPDQTRGWFHSQLAAGVLAFDRAPYDSVLMHGWVNGPDGRQMHKSLGNYIEPRDVTSKFGVDALRFYFLVVNDPWDDKTFQEEGVRVAERTLNILWNVLRFATTYMALDRFDSKANPPSRLVADLRAEDRWLLSRLEGVKATYAREMEGYNLHRAQRAVQAFILDDLSRWYVKLARERTWTESTNRDKLAAYAVLFESLRTVAALLAPATPYLSEAIYQRLDGALLSVHMVDWPAPDPARVDPELERSMGIVQDLVETVAKERQKGGRKLRWPIRLVALRAATPDAAQALDALRKIFLEQANAKELVLLRTDEELPGSVLRLKPDLAAIGRVYREFGPKVASALGTRPPEEVQRALGQGRYEISIEGRVVAIEPAMVRFEHSLPPEVVRAETAHGEVYLDLRLSPQIRAEGYAREIIRRIQQMRKDSNLEVDDYIVTVVQAGQELAAAVEASKGLIERETRSRTLNLADGPVEGERVAAWKDIDGHAVTIGITPLRMARAMRDFTTVLGLSPAKAMLLFDAGYRNLAALKKAPRKALGAIAGLEAADVAEIVRHLSARAVRTKTCPVCGASLPQRATARCPRCGEPLAKKGPRKRR